jgi:hypothetical protein
MKNRILKKISYLLKASHRHGHGIHSPFLFRLITEVIENKGNYSAYPMLNAADENVRNMLRILDMNSYQAGGISEYGYGGKEIKRMHLLPHRFDRLLFRLVNDFSPGGIAFYGSTFGVTLLALAMADRRIQVMAQVENDHYRSFCRRLTEVYEVNNVCLTGSGEVVSADFIVVQNPLDPYYCDRLLAHVLMDSSFDGVIVVGGLHTSDAMEAIWIRHKESPVVRVALDLFEIGIFICRKGLQKEEFVVSF